MVIAAGQGIIVDSESDPPVDAGLLAKIFSVLDEAGRGVPTPTALEPRPASIEDDEEGDEEEDEEATGSDVSTYLEMRSDGTKKLFRELLSKLSGKSSSSFSLVDEKGVSAAVARERLAIAEAVSAKIQVATLRQRMRDCDRHMRDAIAKAHSTRRELDRLQELGEASEAGAGGAGKSR